MIDFIQIAEHKINTQKPLKPLPFYTLAINNPKINLSKQS